ncbi:MAG TPA: hypothetical protein VKW04_10525, partial [Planctomycetota bacterium]|nr:hypothetical protein [Planctomycetota bacterium]
TELDREACGADRSPLLKNLLGDPGGLCFGSVGKDLQGFAFLLPGRTSPHLGPVVARDGAVLTDLLGAVSRHVGKSPVVVDCIRTPAHAWMMERSGLTTARNLTRMTLGQPHPVLMGPLIRAAVSFTWG